MRSFALFSAMVWVVWIPAAVAGPAKGRRAEKAARTETQELIDCARAANELDGLPETESNAASSTEPSLKGRTLWIDKSSSLRIETSSPSSLLLTAQPPAEAFRVHRGKVPVFFVFTRSGGYSCSLGQLQMNPNKKESYPVMLTGRPDPGRPDPLIRENIAFGVKGFTDPEVEFSRVEPGDAKKSKDKKKDGPIASNGDNPLTHVACIGDVDPGEPRRTGYDLLLKGVALGMGAYQEALSRNIKEADPSGQGLHREQRKARQARRRALLKEARDYLARVRQSCKGVPGAPVDHNQEIPGAIQKFEENLKQYDANPARSSPPSSSTASGTSAR